MASFRLVVEVQRMQARVLLSASRANQSVLRPRPVNREHEYAVTPPVPEMEGEPLEWRRRTRGLPSEGAGG
eukprot:15257284-Alexandrium_andersonii.AAC.1